LGGKERKKDGTKNKKTQDTNGGEKRLKGEDQTENMQWLPTWAYEEFA